MSVTFLVDKVKKLCFRALAFLPTRLPVGDQQFEAWYANIAYTYDLPQDNDSIRFALCTMIMQLEAYWRDKNGTTRFSFYTPKRHFGLCLLKGAAQQQAYNIMSDCKGRQEAKKKADEAKAAAPTSTSTLAAVTATTVAVDNGQSGQT